MRTFAFVDIEPNTPEHFEFRKGKIGASMAPDIMGIGFSTPLQLWEQIVFERGRKKTLAMGRGIALEPGARAWINAKMKIDYQPKILQSLKNLWRIASLDGYFEMDGKQQILEIKCPGTQDHLTAIDGRIPEHYMPQLQHQMDVADVDTMHYCSFDGTDGIIVEVERDQEYCKKLLCAETDFFQRIIDFDPPEPNDKDWTRILDPGAIMKAERLLELRGLKKELESEENSLKIELEQDLPHSLCKIGDLKVRKIHRKGAIDYRKIEILKTMDLEEYRKDPICYWEFSS